MMTKKTKLASAILFSSVFLMPIYTQAASDPTREPSTSGSDSGVSTPDNSGMGSGSTGSGSSGTGTSGMDSDTYSGSSSSEPAMTDAKDPKQAFKQLDENSDGNVTQDEVSSKDPLLAGARKFSEYDKDKNGKLSEKEYKKYFEKEKLAS